jgi:4-hydroxybenzoate polyprenyltransferase
LKSSTNISHLLSATRFKDWRLSFVPVIIGVVYFWLYWFKIKLNTDSAILFLLSLITTVGFAAFGYFINEFFDKTSDAKAGKINRLDLIKPVYQLILFLTSTGLMLSPWIWLPADRFTWILISTEIGLFLIYSLPFPRLKSFPFISGIIDSSYAYVIPVILSGHTYELFSNRQVPDYFMMMTIGFFITGYRNILIHQVNDIFRDMRSGIKTLPQKLGTIKTSWAIVIMTVFEWGILISFLSMVSIESPLILICLFGYFLFLIYRVAILFNIKSIRFVSIHPVRHLSDPFFQFWFPLIILGILISFDWYWVVLVPIQVGLISSRSLFAKIGQQLRWCKRMASLIVNYSIYYAFKFFGVDLIKENKSALGYFKYKISKR